jgi:hypothetical protein
VISRVVSGGQTGVDRAGLDAAVALGIPCGGWCPRGRRAENGRIDIRYPLQETPSRDYAERTEWNVRDSDGTLILTRGAPQGGTALTLEIARRLGRPALVFDLAAVQDPGAVRDWLVRKQILVLNVAGPRESAAPGIHGEALRLLQIVLAP